MSDERTDLALSTLRAIMPAELAKADEVFLTGSAAEVTPVGEIAGEVGNYRFNPGRDLSSDVGRL